MPYDRCRRKKEIERERASPWNDISSISSSDPALLLNTNPFTRLPYPVLVKNRRDYDNKIVMTAPERYFEYDIYRKRLHQAPINAQSALHDPPRLRLRYD